MEKELCFVLIPIIEGNRKPNVEQRIYFRNSLLTGIDEAELHPVYPADDVAIAPEMAPIFSNLVLCEYAVVDVTGAGERLCYELGKRESLHPYKTVIMYDEGMPPPIDCFQSKTLPYKRDENGECVDMEGIVARLRELLIEIQAATFVTNPVFQVTADAKRKVAVGHQKTDVFRQQVFYSPSIKEKLSAARDTGKEAILRLKEKFDVDALDPAVLIDFLLSFRAVDGWEEMVSLCREMPPVVRELVMVQEQLAFALNRLGDSEEAEAILHRVLKRVGPNSETLGILGRVYKDRWEDSLDKGNQENADDLLEQAIDTYIKGFEADWRDAYPGISSITLLEIKAPEDPRKEELLPIVTYSLKRKIELGSPDYWDYASLLEIAVISDSPEEVSGHLDKMSELIREQWEAVTTSRNIRLIRESRQERGIECPWIIDIEARLERLTKI